MHAVHIWSRHSSATIQELPFKCSHSSALVRAWLHLPAWNCVPLSLFARLFGPVPGHFGLAREVRQGSSPNGSRSSFCAQVVRPKATLKNNCTPALKDMKHVLPFSTCKNIQNGCNPTFGQLLHQDNGASRQWQSYCAGTPPALLCVFITSGRQVVQQDLTHGTPAFDHCACTILQHLQIVKSDTLSRHAYLQCYCKTTRESNFSCGFIC
eukprot:1157904-Pelagomonas_calceolata.AAC.4